MHHGGSGRKPSDRSTSAVLLPRQDAARPPDHLGLVLAPRCRPAIPAVHVPQQLHHDLPVEQCAQPARRHPVGHHQRGQLRGAPCGRVEHLLRPPSGSHRSGSVVPENRAPSPCGVVLLGLRRLVLRGGPRPDLHRIGLGPDRRTGVCVPLWADRPDGMATVSSQRTGRRSGAKVGIASSAAAQGIGGQRRRSWSGAGTGRWRRSCSCCPTTEPRRRCRARSQACQRASRAPTPTS